MQKMKILTSVLFGDLKLHILNYTFLTLLLRANQILYFCPKIVMATLHPLRVAQVDHITPRAVVLYFDVPENLSAPFQYEAGQYLTLEAEIDGTTVRRSYSICTAPHEGLLAVGIKQIPNGVFSSYAKQEIKEGSILNVGVPEGRFTYVPAAKKEKITAFGAGSGITPLLSIAKTALRAGHAFTLVYGNTTPEETLFTEEIEQLKKDSPAQFQVVNIYSRATVTNAFSGRIDAPFISEQWESQQLSADKYYLCGPEGMILSTEKALEEKGVKKENVFHELFTSTSATAAAASNEGSANVVIICDGVTHTLADVPMEKTILDAALLEKIDAPYSCQGGVCSSCIARVKEGDAVMDTNQILTDGEVAEGLILTCQAHPTSATIIVDYDDV
jgi:ring-1,2-phenylacetyl-CoA epoxidase subunit PaaE